MTLIGLTWAKGNKFFTVCWHRKGWKESGEGPQWGIHTNGAFKKKDSTCLDVSIYLGYLCIDYTNFMFRKENKQNNQLKEGV